MKNYTKVAAGGKLAIMAEPTTAGMRKAIVVVGIAILISGSRHLRDPARFRHLRRQPWRNQPHQPRRNLQSQHRSHVF